MQQSMVMSQFCRSILENKNYVHTKPSGHRETWEEASERVVMSVMGPYMPKEAKELLPYVVSRKLIPGGRYLYAAGRKYHQVNNCFLFMAEDSRDGPGGWADTMYSVTSSLMTGGGVGVVYSKLRGKGNRIAGLGGESTGPIALMQMVNEAGRHIVQGGSRRSAIWAGLHWNHPDIFDFLKLKDWNEHVKRAKAEDYNNPAPMDGTNVSVILDDSFFAAYADKANPDHTLACNVYWASVRHMLAHGEPGFSVDIGDNAGEHCRNACTEVTSSLNGDMCNLASINLGRIVSEEEMTEVVRLGTAFLMCGTLYSKLPVPFMYGVREKTRRLGLGLMGVHEWFLRRGKRYGVDHELGKWMDVYKMSGGFANLYADRMSISRPVATRSIAPTGTIAIIGETTCGIEPMMAAAYKRRYLEGRTWKAQYVLDPTAERLVREGVDPDLIEDSFTLAEDVERRMAFQTWMQERVDHGISSTINLPAWGTPLNNEGTVTQFGEQLIKYLPGVRGMTVYPNGARSGQPYVRMPYAEAVAKGIGKAFEDGRDLLVVEPNEESCSGGICGT